jgi:hypothetical protein
MDVQEFFKSLNFCLDVLKSIGIFSKNKFHQIFWIIVHSCFYNGFLFGIILKLNSEDVDEMWKIAEKLSFIIGMIALDVKFLKVLSGIQKIHRMKEKSEEILIMLNDENLQISGNSENSRGNRGNIEESSFLRKVFRMFSTITLLPLTSCIFFMPFLSKLTFDVLYPFDLSNIIWFRTAAFHQGYCHVFAVTIFISNSFLSVVFMSYSSGFLDQIHKKLYYKTGMNREIVLANCMKSYELIKRLVCTIHEHFEYLFLFQTISNIFTLGLLFFIITEATEVENQIVAICLCFPITFEFLIPFQFGQDLMLRSQRAIEAFSYPKWQDINEPIEIARKQFLRKYFQKLEIKVCCFNLSIKSFLIMIAASLLCCAILKFLKKTYL